MTLFRSIVFGLTAMAALLAASTYLANGNDMKKFAVNIIVSEQIEKFGGLLVVVPNKIDPDEFIEKYEKYFEERSQEESRGGSERYIVDILADSTVSFLHMDVPGSDYAYRFLLENASGNSRAREKQIGIGSEGAIYMDLATDSPVEAKLSMDHHIEGRQIDEGHARGLQSATLNMWVDASSCEVKGPVRLCKARDSDVSEQLSLFDGIKEKR